MQRQPPGTTNPTKAEPKSTDETRKPPVSGAAALIPSFGQFAATSASQTAKEEPKDPGPDEEWTYQPPKKSKAMEAPKQWWAGWIDDPTRRFEYRYWDGSAWTPHVSSDGVTASDPLSLEELGLVD